MLHLLGCLNHNKVLSILTFFLNVNDNYRNFPVETLLAAIVSVSSHTSLQPSRLLVKQVNC